MKPAVYAIATMDTKGHELEFVAERLRAAGVAVVTVDVGTLEQPVVPPDICRETVLGHCPTDPSSEAHTGSQGRADAIAEMSAALVSYLTAEHAAGRLTGAIGLGGGGGTSLIAPALRALPVGVPKLLISTMASGNVGPYVGTSDLLLLHSVVDVAGLNSVSRRVLANGAHAMAGMLSQAPPATIDAKPTVAMTMFGVTTPCVDRVRRQLEAEGYDCLVFHATGAGGQAMEQLVDAGLIQGVLDITTTEVADLLVGGVLPAGPERFDAMLRRGVPYVLSLGALDMVNFGALETVPPQFRERRLHVHNAQVTLMRTTADENRAFARWIAAKLNRSHAPLVVMVPELGVSALDAPGQPFHDSAADRALFDELERAIEQNAARRIVRHRLHINDPAFAEALVEQFLALARHTS